MSRVQAFDGAYAASRSRLLLQLYAYCGDADVADDALDEAFIAASRQWRRVGATPNLDGWLRERAIRRIDGRPGVLREAADERSAAIWKLSRSRGRTRPPTPAPELAATGAALANPVGALAAPAGAHHLIVPSIENARLLAVLNALDPVSRRLLVVRRLDDTPLAVAADEVGLTEAAAEQVLARAITSLHAAGVDTTPIGLTSHLARLAEDLEGRPDPTPAGALRKAGARRRYAKTAVVVAAGLAVLAAAGAVVVEKPFSSSPEPRSSPTPGGGRTTLPIHPVVDLTKADLVSATVVADAAPGKGWSALPDPGRPTEPTGVSIYGQCVMAADDPPPETSWVRNFTANGRPGSPADGPLRQVLSQAPSIAEARRLFHRLSLSFTSCASHQLIGYQSVSGLGDRARLVSLRFALPGGPVRQSVLLVRSGESVSVFSAKSAPGKPGDLTTDQLSTIAAAAVDNVCSQLSSACASAPYSLGYLKPPSDGTAGRFLSVVDLPLVPGVAAAWAGTNPSTSSSNPSATLCDQADFTGSGGYDVTSRSYVMPDAGRLPVVFGITETIGTFASPADARTFLDQAATRVRSCQSRHPTMTVQGSTTFTSHVAVGKVWRIKQKVSKQESAIYRVALVRHGSSVAQVTFTPAGRYDVSQSTYVALARRAGVRLAG